MAQKKPKQNVQKVQNAWRPWGDHPWFVAISTLAALATIVGILFNSQERGNTPKPDARPASQPAPAGTELNTPHSVGTSRLPEDVARAQIRSELHGERVGAAIELMRGLQAGPEKLEECERIFSYCIKNPSVDNALERASQLASECWDGSAKQEKLELIGLTKLKEK